jgi:hypothetical protein
MITLSLADTEAAIQAAFDHYLLQDSHPFTITLSGHRVQVTIHLSNDRFDCGTPGYVMANADVNKLGEWVPANIIQGKAEGALAACKNVGKTGQVNAYLLGKVTFNFHVNLVNAC